MAIEKQMELFDDGGLMDEGGTVDPESGNDVPTGSLQEEVRDDIPAQLSEGEFVLPADVVRYHGLEKIMELRDEAKRGLQKMEAMGQMGNSEEATLPDDVPFSIDDLEIEEDREYQVGGYVPPVGVQVTSAPGVQIPQQSQFTGYQPQYVQYQPPAAPPMQPAQQAPVPTQPQFDFTLGGTVSYATYVDDLGNTMQIPVDANGNPLQPVPPGYYKEGQKPTPEQPAPTPEQPTQTPTVPVQQQDTGSGDDEQFEAEPFGGTPYALSNKNLRSATLSLAKSQLTSLSPQIALGTALKDKFTGKTTPTPTDVAVAGNQARKGALSALGLQSMADVSSDAQAAFIGDVMGAAMTATKNGTDIVEGYETFVKDNELNKYSGSTATAAQTPEAEAARAAIIDAAKKSLEGKTAKVEEVAGTAAVETTLTQPDTGTTVGEAADTAKDAAIAAFGESFEIEPGKQVTESDIDILGFSDTSRLGTDLTPVEQTVVAQAKFASLYSKHGGNINAMIEDETSTLDPASVKRAVRTGLNTQLRSLLSTQPKAKVEVEPATKPAPRDPIVNAKEIREQKQSDPNYNPYTDTDISYTSSTGTTFNASGIGVTNKKGESIQGAGKGYTFASGYLSTDSTGKVTGAAIPGSEEHAARSAQAGGDSGDTSSGGGCCFIMLEARYGDGTMDEVVRRYRDEYMTDKNKRGYYKLAEVFVPLMRKYPAFKWLVTKTFADPLVSYGKYYYGQNKHGVLYSPVKSFWMKVFDVLGTDTEFVRENGEVV